MNAGAILIAVLVAAALAVTLGVALGWAAARIEPNADSLVERIDALLPQTQCGQCRYPGCRPYAAAIASGAAEIDRCPPGGEATVRALAEYLIVRRASSIPSSGCRSPRRWHGSTRPGASVARAACPPARSMPSSVHPGRCTQ